MAKYTKKRRRTAYELGVIRKNRRKQRAKEFKKYPKNLRRWLSTRKKRKN